MTGTIKKVTKNYNMRIPIFDAPGWGREISRNIDIIDAALYLLSGITDIKGIWLQNTNYLAGSMVIDPDNNLVFRCLITHTTPTSGSFIDERNNNPTYWEQVPSSFTNAGEWAPNTVYSTNQFVFTNNKWGIIRDNYQSSSSFDTDVSNGHIAVLLDITQQFADQSEGEAGTSDDLIVSPIRVAQYVAAQIGTTLAAASQGVKADSALQPSNIGNNVQAYDDRLQSLIDAVGVVGQVPNLKSDGTFELADAGSGDMRKNVFDPNGKNDDAFDQDNMVDGTTNKNYTATDKARVATSIQPADDDASGFGFTVDEDDMASNSATKVPTQQSVKAYADTKLSGAVTADDTALSALSAEAALNLGNEGWWLPTADDISTQIAAGDARYIGTSGDATGASGGWYQAGAVQTGFYYAEDGARIARMADRLMVGDATGYNGEAAATSAGTWLHDIGSTNTMHWIITNTTIAGVGSRGIGVMGAARVTTNGGSSFGGVTYSYNSRVGSTTADKGWGRYNEVVRGSGAGNAIGDETDVTNLAASPNTSGLYPGATLGAGTTIAQMFAAGGDPTVNPTTYDVDGVIDIVNNGAKFKTILSARLTALVRDGGATGRAHATRLPYDTALEWYEFSTNTLALSIVSQISDAGHKQEMRFSNAGMLLLDDAGNTYFRAQWLDNVVNYPDVVGSVSGAGYVNFAATGTDTDIDIRLTPKGAGVFNYQKAHTVASSAGAFSAVRYFPIKLNGVTHYVPCSPSTW